MSRAIPAPMNCLQFGNPQIALSGADYVATVAYQTCVRYQVNGAWVVRAVPWMQQGTGQVSVTEANTVSLAAVQQSLISAAAAAEGLTTGDFVVLPDGTVVTL